MKNGVLMFLALCLSACASQAKLVEGNGHVVTREIPVEAFDEIHIGPSITNSGLLYNGENQKKRPEFRYSQEARKVLVVTADENLFSELDIRVRDGELTIRTKDNVRIRPRLNEVSISGSTRFSCMTSLEGDLLEVSVSGSGVADFPQSARLSNADLSVSGSGLVSLGQLTCERVDGQVSGSGCVSLKGEGQEIDYSVSGSAPERWTAPTIMQNKVIAPCRVVVRSRFMRARNWTCRYRAVVRSVTMVRRTFASPSPVQD